MRSYSTRTERFWNYTRVLSKNRFRNNSKCIIIILFPQNDVTQYRSELASTYLNRRPVFFSSVKKHLNISKFSLDNKATGQNMSSVRNCFPPSSLKSAKVKTRQHRPGHYRHPTGWRHSWRLVSTCIAVTSLWGAPFLWDVRVARV